MNNLNKLLLFSSFALVNTNVDAADATIGPVYIYSVASLNFAVAGHIAGNLEIQIRNGFTVPSPLSCDANYLTTLKSSDPDKKLYGTAMSALALKLPVNLYITDNPNLTAFGGRCSIEAISIIQP